MTTEREAIFHCEGCGKPIYEGERYHPGEDVELCEACSPDWTYLLAHPENFRGEDDEPMAAAEAFALFDAHIKSGGSPDDKMATTTA